MDISAHDAARTARERLRQRHVRATPQRTLVLEALMVLGGHISADDIMHWVVPHQPDINLATIYRTLDRLLTLGIVSQTDLGGGRMSYELIGEVAHHHLVCESCGAVMELDDETLATLRDALLAKYGFLMLSSHVALFGHCEACRMRASGSAAAN